jgi:hypothetical protein
VRSQIMSGAVPSAASRLANAAMIPKHTVAATTLAVVGRVATVGRDTARSGPGGPRPRRRPRLPVRCTNSAGAHPR